MIRKRKSPRTGDGGKEPVVTKQTVSHQSGLSLLIVDDHAVVREGLVAMLGTDPDIVRIHTAANASEVVPCCESSLPDVILLDLRMPGEDGFSVLRTLLKRWPGLRILILSASATPAETRLARRDGAVGFLSKSADRKSLLAAIRIVAEGGNVFPFDNSETNLARSITGRELEVMQHLGRGLTRVEIGRALGISEETVKTHLKGIFAKLGASDRAEAVSRCYELGLF